MSTANLPAQARATVDDLREFEGKAELIGGRIVPLMPTGHRPNLVAFEIACSLRSHVRATGVGFAYTDNVVFVVPELSSGREAFSPDAAYYGGPPPADEMDLISGPPTFAVEVRSKGDYGVAAERAMAAKRAEYFEAGTAVVWDVDPIDEVIRSYRREAPGSATLFKQDEVADAEPAVPGWRVAVDDLFR